MKSSPLSIGLHIACCHSKYSREKFEEFLGRSFFLFILPEMPPAEVGRSRQSPAASV